MRKMKNNEDEIYDKVVPLQVKVSKVGNSKSRFLQIPDDTFREEIEFGDPAILFINETKEHIIITYKFQRGKI